MFTKSCSRELIKAEISGIQKTLLTFLEYENSNMIIWKTFVNKVTKKSKDYVENWT